MPTIELPCFGIVVNVTGDGCGTIASDLHDNENIADFEYEAALFALESLILAHACAGINIESPAYIKGIETAVDAIGNNL